MKLTLSQIAQALQMFDAPFMLLMIGPPGSGKSTAIRGLAASGVKFHVASTDDILERMAEDRGITYSQAHQTLSFKQVKAEMLGSMNAAFIRKESVINDQTNLSSKKRRTTLERAPSHYIRVGLTVGDSLTLEDLDRRLIERKQTTGKEVSMGIVREMLKTSSAPSKTEGFNHLWELA